MHIIFGQYALHWRLWWHFISFALSALQTSHKLHIYYFTMKGFVYKVYCIFYRTKGSQAPEEHGTSSLLSVLCVQTRLQYRGPGEKEVSGQKEHHRIQPIKSVDCLLQSNVRRGTPDVKMGGTMAEKEATSHQHQCRD